MIDPSTSTVAAVAAYLDEHPEEAEAVKAAEAEGKARQGIMEWEPAPVADAADGSPVELPEGAKVVTADPRGEWERLEVDGEPVTVDGEHVQVVRPKPRTDLAGRPVTPA